MCMRQELCMLNEMAGLLNQVPLLLLLGSNLLQFGWAIVCYHCDSIALPECAQTLGEVDILPYVDCSRELTCAMSIVDSITYRGCGADTPTTGATYSKSCSVNLCNAGVYPPGRLKCHQCAGESCVEAPAGKPRPCRYHQEEDECFTEVLSTSEAYRGCMSDTNHTASNAAILCEYNGCNEQLGAWSQTCARCDSREGRGCKMDLFQVNTGKCNVSLYEECKQDVLLGNEEDDYCFSFRQLSRVVRGCSTQLPNDLEPFRDQLEKCHSGDRCNAECINQQRCLSCNSGEQELCRTNATAVSSSVCGSAEVSSCFACEYANWQIRRGCGAPPSDPDTLNCYECDEDGGCNKLDFTRCYRCSTNESGAACANWERPGGVYIEECVDPSASCLVLSYVNGTTERGCQRKDFTCSSANVTNCRQCEGSFCNKGAFPAQRLWCHQCTDCKEIARGHTALPCARLANEPLDQAEGCLEYYDLLKEQVVRGCRSNSELYYECLLRSDPGKCHICHTEACNDSPEEKLRPLKRFDKEALALLLAKSSTSSITVTFKYWLISFGLALYIM